jgi:hypothetical protein
MIISNITTVIGGLNDYQIDPYNLVISLFFGLIGIYIAYQANLIAKRTLEQNRPKLVLKDIVSRNGINSVSLYNDGNFEASKIFIFYKNAKQRKISLVNYSEIYLSPATGVNISFKNSEDQAVLILYENPLTKTIYLTGQIIILDRNEVKSFSDDSVITNEDFVDVLKLTRTKKDILYISNWISNNF